jgi:hypothetical protein
LLVAVLALAVLAVLVQEVVEQADTELRHLSFYQHQQIIR